jgi:hypothetical protein
VTLLMGQAVPMAAAQNDQVPSLVRAQQFQLVDPDGTVRIEMRTIPQQGNPSERNVSMVMLTQAGAPRVSLTAANERENVSAAFGIPLSEERGAGQTWESFASLEARGESANMIVEHTGFEAAIRTPTDYDRSFIKLSVFDQGTYRSVWQVP